MSDWTPAVVALDVDGTLVTYAGFHDPPTAPVAAAVRRVLEAGSQVVVTTGRSVHVIKSILDSFDQRAGFAVCSNGAVVLDVSTSQPVHVVTFDAGDPVRYFTEKLPDVLLAVEEKGMDFRITGEFPAGELDGAITVVDHDDLLRGEVTRLVVRWPNGDREKLRELALASGLPSVDYAIGYTAWLDIMPEGVSKASGLDYVVGQLGVPPADVLAIGDGHNDVEMLRWAGHGVAMGQAPDDVKVVADEVCGTVDDDGVVDVLDRYFA